jgi:tRNA G10  N-methylase Trm11
MTNEQENLPGFLSQIPVSVIDIGAQKKRAVGEDHAKKSSRSSYSPFPAEIADLCYEFYLRDATLVFDPFAGWGERAAKAHFWGKRYVGVDISQAAIDTAWQDYGQSNILADVRGYDIPPFDGLLTCPPYWNLETYDGGENLSRTKTWEAFLSDLHVIFKRCYSAALPGATLCVMVGDWRKNHKYYDLEYEVSSMFKTLGADIVDKVVVSRKKVSKIKIMLPQAKRLGYTVRVHENLLVFKK